MGWEIGELPQYFFGYSKIFDEACIFAVMDPITYHQCPVCSHSGLQPHLECRDYLVSRQIFPIEVCPQCGFGVTQKVPPPDQIGDYYKSEQYISHSDTKEGLVNALYHKIRDLMLVRKRKLVERFHSASPGIILDIGCGTGYFLAHMKNHGWSVDGTEVDQDARAIATAQLGQEVWGSEGLFDLEDDQYGAVTMWHVLEHIHSLSDYLTKINSVLKHEGILIVAVPNYTSSDGGWYGSDWAAYDVPRHLWHFSPQSARMLIESHGFRLLTKNRMPFDPFYISMMSEKYRGHRLAMVKGGFRGGISYLKSLADIDRSSSIIYVFRKQLV